MTKFNFTDYIEENTLRAEVSHRGGGIEIDASEYLLTEGAKMTAYQNYLGGGLTGAVQFDCNIRDWQKTEVADRVEELGTELMKYFYNQTNPVVDEWDEWSSTESFEEQQSRPVSAY